MIIFANIFLTNKRFENLCPPYDRGSLKSFDNIDIWKYTLDSMSVLPYTHVFINCKLDECYKNQEKELVDYTCSKFTNIEYRFDRLEIAKDWKNFIKEKIDPIKETNLIWFTGNHDHVYIAPNNNILEWFIDKFNLSNEFKQIHLSHWPELLKRAKKENYEKEGPFLKFKSHSQDSIQLVTKEALKAWFHIHDTYVVPRTDILPIQNICSQTFVPNREIVRHFDGYNHVTISGNDCSPLEIPHSYKCIYGEYCTPEQLSVRTWGLNKWSDGINGSDWQYEDLPLFWRKQPNFEEYYDFEYDFNFKSNYKCSILRVANSYARFVEVTINEEDLSL